MAGQERKEAGDSAKRETRDHPFVFLLAFSHVMLPYRHNYTVKPERVERVDLQKECIIPITYCCPRGRSATYPQCMYAFCEAGVWVNRVRGIGLAEKRLRKLSIPPSCRNQTFTWGSGPWRPEPGAIRLRGSSIWTLKKGATDGRAGPRREFRALQPPRTRTSPCSGHRCRAGASLDGPPLPAVPGEKVNGVCNAAVQLAIGERGFFDARLLPNSWRAP